ncbi:hypothetical protein SMF913_10125 [Streptomyces malaysiensis]|uniref:Uncharacterized protein n=1 Tax=Streptomyces malaysiensis TaxID=92644 RepID=A0A2J7Z1F1_STRMQ|nr:hypothetical protein SMF913_10125 [Streptomyces malaysiensis]
MWPLCLVLLWAAEWILRRCGVRESHRPDWVSEKRCQHGTAEVLDVAEE